MREQDSQTKLLEKIRRGDRIEPQEAASLFEAPLHLLGELANDRRNSITNSAYNGQGARIVTYTIDRNINYTNICSTRCRFCAFSRSPQDPDAYVISLDELDRKTEEALRCGATQILLQGGHNPALTLDWILKVINHIKTRFPTINIHGLSPSEIIHFYRQTNLPLDQILIMLKQAGLGSLPGGGAEILVDRVRKIVTPNKATAEEWIQVMDAAHQVGLFTTATMMFGHVETRAERIEHLEKLRRLQDRALTRRKDAGFIPPISLPPPGSAGTPPPGPGCFTSFTCWTYQPKNTPLGGMGLGAVEYLRTLAISRIYLDNFPSIQCSWVTQGPEVGQLALFYGANDFGSVMLEENVVRAAGAKFYLTETEIRRLIAEVGFEPHKRDTWYRLID